MTSNAGGDAAAEAALRLAEALCGSSSGGPGEALQTDIDTVESDVARGLQRRWPALAEARCRDWAEEAVQRFLIKAADCEIQVDEPHKPLAYVRAIARNLA